MTAILQSVFLCLHKLDCKVNPVPRYTIHGLARRVYHRRASPRFPRDQWD